jgi:23S rRNA pseudouridine1911/1915/1917 synthase
VRRRLTLGGGDAGRALGDVLADRLGEEGGRLLAAGAVFVDRRRASAGDSARRLGGAERLEVEDAPGGPLTDLEVLFADEHVAFVHKPPGVSSTGDLRGTVGTLVAACALRFGAAHLAGRLDRDASGVVLVLVSERARREVPIQRRAGGVERTYVVLSDRRPSPPEGEVDAPIGKDPRRGGRMRIGGEDAREARTRYASGPIGLGAEVRARPRTGRTHQVRLHLASVGAPVLGDAAYGGATRLVAPDGAVLGISRIALHCEEIALAHPTTGARLVIRRAPGPDFERLRQALSTALPRPAPSRGRRPSRG